MSTFNGELMSSSMSSTRQILDGEALQLMDGHLAERDVTEEAQRQRTQSAAITMKLTQTTVGQLGDLNC